MGRILARALSWRSPLPCPLTAPALSRAVPDLRKPPALRLGDAATPIDYEAALAIDPTGDAFTGAIRIRFRLNRVSQVVWMNATQLSISAATFRQGDHVIPVEVIPGGADFVGFMPKEGAFAAGDMVATIAYKGALEPTSTRGLFRQREAGEWYVVSQFEAYSARRAFPCFDEPGWKTPWKLAVDAPAAHVVVSNTPEVAVSDTPGLPGWKRHTFKQTAPLPTYLIALAVGPFEVVDGGTAGANNTPLRYLAPKGRGAEMRYAKESTPRLLELMEAYFGSPYPFEKLDTVTIAQTVGFGAMENVGMITYAANILLAHPNEESVAFRRRYATIAAHEIAHMWFGNLVTPAWWDDIWLNEAFATWMGRKIAYQMTPAWDTAFQRNFGRSRALYADRLPSTRRIRNPVIAKDDINAAFDRITYDKGGELLSMFEAWLTPDIFRQGVRNYINARRYGTATSRDFFLALGEAAGKGEAAVAAFNAFVEQPGIPLMDAARSCEPGQPPAILLKQQRLSPAGTRPPPMQWTTPACFRYGSAAADTFCTEVKSGEHRIALPQGSPCPEWVAGNVGGGGHYVVRPDDRLLMGRTLAQRDLPAAEVAAMVFDASLLSRAGLMPIDNALMVFKRAFAHASPSVHLAAVEALRLVNPEHLRPGNTKAEIDEAAVQPLAKKIGWAAKAGESDEIEALRIVLLPYAAQVERDGVLRAEARRRALQWLKDRDGIDAAMVTPVLDTAARFADADTYAKLEAATLSTTNLRDKRQLQSAIAKVRDEKLRARMLALAVEKRSGADRMPGREVLQFMEDALEDDANRGAAFAFVRGNFDALRAKLPTDTPANFARSLERLCTPAERESFVSFWKESAPAFIGGQRKYELAREAIDICVAAAGR